MEGQDYQGQDRRKYPRLDEHYIISHRVLEEDADFGLSQTKNVSLGGALIASSSEYKPGTILELIIKVPFQSERVKVKGEVVGSIEAVKNVMYETRIKFIDMPGGFVEEFEKFLENLQEE